MLRFFIVSETWRSLQFYSDKLLPRHCSHLNMFLFTLLVTLLLLVIIRAVRRKHNAIYTSQNKLTGKTVLVTGGTSGIGLNIAMDFAIRGAKVIIACPFEDEGIKARNKIIKKSENENVVFKFLDLASLKSVRKLAADINKNENRLDILVNNAGIGLAGNFKTDDGINFIMQVNYYGHFLLTILLLPLLKKSGTQTEPSRIINMSSISRHLASSDIDNYNKTGYWYMIRIYANSKLSLILFAHELSKKLIGTNVVVNCADPGFVSTRIYQSYIVFIGKLLQIIINLIFKNPWEGAQTAIFMAVDQKAGEVSGQVFENCKLKRTPSWKTIDKCSNILWKQSAKLVLLEDSDISNLILEDNKRIIDEDSFND